MYIHIDLYAHWWKTQAEPRFELTIPALIAVVVTERAFAALLICFDNFWLTLTNMNRPERKPSLRTLCRVSTQISLRMPHRLTRMENFRLL